MIRDLGRRIFNMPKARCRTDSETFFIAMRDGVRLSTTHIWPLDAEGATPTLLARTPYGVHARPGAMTFIGRMLAESGYHVVLQDVRGRYQSEGKFEPFTAEAEDGADTLLALASQPWCEGKIGLFGASYLTYCAWAAAATAPEQVGSLALAIGSSDLYSLFYPQGIFSFANSLEWATGVGDREGIGAQGIDLERGFAFEPFRDADRVARRRNDTYRAWVDHPNRDAYWAAIHPTIPSPAPPTLLIGGYWDFFLPSQLDDYRTLVEGAQQQGGAAPELMLGPWSHGLPAMSRLWRDGLHRHALRGILDHFDTTLAGRGAVNLRPPVRYFVCDPGGRGDWSSTDRWPPSNGNHVELYLGEPGSSLGLSDTCPDATEASDSLRYDPLDPTPTCGGALFGLKAGARDQRVVAGRKDVLVYDSPVLEEEIAVAGAARAHLFVSAEHSECDFAVHLVDLQPSGRALNICSGLARLNTRVDGADANNSAEAGSRVHTLIVEMGDCAYRLPGGHRIRIQIAPADCPRYARSRGDEAHGDRLHDPEPSEQTVHRSALHPSSIEVSLGPDTGHRPIWGA